MAAEIGSVVKGIEQVVGYARRPVSLHEPLFAGSEWAYTKECLDTGWVSSVGKFVDEFEKRLAESCGAKAGVAVVNGTAALHLALKLVGVSSGDEVIMPALTFVATANATTYCGAIPHFVDSEESSLGLSPTALERHLEKITILSGDNLVNSQTGRPIRAVIPVHLFGHPVDFDLLQKVCARFRLPIVEDATESLGSAYRGRPCGCLGLVGVLSFNGNKIITTGGGGALITNDVQLAKRAKHLSTTARMPHRWGFIHDQIGWNYRLPNINAALGLAQLEQLDHFVAAKRRLAARYEKAFADIRGTKFVSEPQGSVSNYWLNSILLTEDDEQHRDAILEATNNAGLCTRPAWVLMHRLPMFKECPRGELSVAESIERRLINLPSSAFLGNEDNSIT